MLHASVAEKGVSATVRTSEITGGGPLGTVGVVVVVVVVLVVSAGGSVDGAVAPVGNAMNVRSRAYGAEYDTAPLSAGASAVTADAASTPEMRCRPTGASRPV